MKKIVRYALICVCTFLLKTATAQNVIEDAHVIFNYLRGGENHLDFYKTLLKYDEHLKIEIKSGEKVDVRLVSTSTCSFYQESIVGYFNKLDKNVLLLSAVIDVSKDREIELLREKLNNLLDFKDTSSLKKQLNKEDIEKTRSKIEELYIKKINALIRYKGSDKVSKEVSMVAMSKQTNEAKEFTMNLAKKEQKMSLPSQTEAIDALAIFIAGRVKDEIALSFIDDLKKKISQVPELLCMFPNTIQKINESDFYELPNFGIQIKEAIRQDFLSLPDHIIDCFDFKNEELKDEIKAILTFRKKLMNGVDYRTLVSFYADENNFGLSYKNTEVYKIFSLMHFLNETMMTAKENAIWVNPTDMEKDPQFIKIYLSLMGVKFHKTLTETFNVSLCDSIADNKKIQRMNSDIKSILYKLNEFESYIELIKSNNSAYQQDADRINQELFACVDSIFSTVGSVFNKNYSTKIRPLFTGVLSFYQKSKTAINDKDYSSLIFYTMEMMEVIYKEKMVAGSNINLMTVSRFQKAIESADIKKLRYLEKAFEVLVKMDASNVNADTLRKLAGKDGYNYFGEKFPELKKAIDKKATDEISRYLAAIKSKKEYKDFERMMGLIDSVQFLSFSADTSISEKLDELIRMKVPVTCKFKEMKNYVCAVTRLNTDILKRKQADINSNKINNHYNIFISTGKFVSLLNDVVKAENSKSLSEVIKQYSAPVQSYKVKRKNRFSIDFSAYPGLYAGVEGKQGHGILKKSTSFVTGITCPLGISLSFGTKKTYKPGLNKRPNGSYYIKYKTGEIKELKGGSTTFSLTLIDIGAAFAYRWSNDSSATLPKEVNFAQVLAPGCFVGWGIKNTPLILNAGAQFVPQLRDFNTDGESENTFRFSVSVAFDIPIWNITHSAKRFHR